MKEFSANAVLEVESLINSERVGLGDDWNDIDDLAELFHNDHVNRAETVAGGVDKEQAAVNTRVLDITVALSGELFSEVGRMLVLDVFNDGVPARISHYQ